MGWPTVEMILVAALAVSLFANAVFVVILLYAKQKFDEFAVTVNAFQLVQDKKRHELEQCIHRAYASQRESLKISAAEIEKFGEILERMGAPLDARNAYETALAYDADNQKARENFLRLASPPPRTLYS